MTHDEFERFLKTLFAQLPGLWLWLNETSPNLPATTASWERTLANVTFFEGLHVLADWESGAKSPPAAYERELVAVVIRQSVMRDRDLSRRRDSRQALSVEARRREYRPTALGIPSVRDAYERGRELRKRYIEGIVEQATYERELEELLHAC